MAGILEAEAAVAEAGLELSAEVAGEVVGCGVGVAELEDADGGGEGRDGALGVGVGGVVGLLGGERLEEGVKIVGVEERGGLWLGKGLFDGGGSVTRSRRDDWAEVCQGAAAGGSGSESGSEVG